MRRVLTLLVAALCVGLGQSRAASFENLYLDLMNGNFLTTDEVSNKTSVEFGIAVTDGTATRVEKGSENSIATLSGKYHSNEHGWNNFKLVVPVTGSVKITVGTCAWGGNVTVTDADGNSVIEAFTTNTGACYHNNTTDNVVTKYYSGGSTTLTIAGGSYMPYCAVETVDESEIPNNATVTFALPDNSEIAGSAPSAQTISVGESITIPANRLAYYEGYTLTGWTDGTNTYAAGDTYSPTADATLTAVFTANTVALADRTSDVTLKWDFQSKNGAPTLSYQGVSGFYVTQGEVNGSTIDVKMDFDTSSGKLNNTNWTDWAQVNGGTTFTIPSCKGATVSMEAYSNITTTTIDGQSDYTQGTTISYEISSTSETVDIVIGDGSYYRYIQTVLPVVESSGASFSNAEGTIYWTVGNEENGTVATDISDAISAATVSTGSDLTVTTNAYSKAESGTLATYQPGTSSAGNVETVMIEYRVKPKAGVTFTPTNVSFDAVKVGTDGATFSYSYTIDGVESEVTQVDASTVRRNNGANNETADLNHSVDISASAAGEFTFRFYISKTANNKKIALGNIVITGTVDGTVQDVNQYTLTATPSIENGGTVNIYPSGGTYDEGTTIKLTATKNFGYKFVNWTDANGNEVSADNVYTFDITSDQALTANFEAVNTYQLTINVEGGANDYMVSMDPEPTEVDGKYMYEEGTTVALTASSNPILTFTNWSDGTSSSEKSVAMTEDVTLTANYSAIDYIAGWDFYLKGNNGRIADFYAADNDADAFNLVNEETGETSGWLDKSQEAAGGYEGKPAAVNWRTGSSAGDVGHYYWKTMVNAEAFTGIKVQFEMLYNYNSYTTYNVEYSLDDATYTSVGSVTMSGAKNWTSCEVTLPEDANNQSKVYIRWTPDKTSSIDGTSSANDGNAITAVYITGTAELVDDGTAPVLVSSVPESGSTTASANGKIVLTFDEKVKLADGVTATLGDQTLTGTVSGKTVIFEYKGLDYNTDYTFTLPAGSVTDLTNNALDEAVTINFTTQTRPTVTKGIYDFVVPDEGNLEEAIAAANSRSDKSMRYRIFVKKGATYTLPQGSATKTYSVDLSDGTKATYTKNDPITYITAANISLIGEERDETIVTNTIPESDTFTGKYGTASIYEGIGNSDVLQMSSSVSGLYMQDITISTGMGDAMGRDIAIQDKGTKNIYKNVHLNGYQDTWTSNNDRGLYYFEGGKLRGRTDFLCGKGDIFFNEVNLVMCAAGGYLAVPSKSIKYGYVFKDCTIDGEADGINGNYTLGRPWGSGTPKAYYINTTMNVQPSTIGWSEMSGGYPAQFAEYNSMTSTGTVIDLAGRKTTFGDGHTNVPTITSDEAAEIGDMTNMYGDWDPTYYTEQASAPTNVVLTDNTLTWDNNDYVFCWAICVDGYVQDFTIEPTYDVSKLASGSTNRGVRRADSSDVTYSVRAANEMGGLGEATEAVVSTGINEVNAEAGQVVATDYYNAAGMKINNTKGGVVIKVQTLEDGRKVVTKSVK